MRTQSTSRSGVIVGTCLTLVTATGVMAIVLHSRNQADPSNGAAQPGIYFPSSLGEADLRPYGPPQRGTESLPWEGKPGSARDYVDVYYSPGCHDRAFVQVKEESQQIVLRVVRAGPRSANLCGTQIFQRVGLSRALGDRKVIHDALYDYSKH